MEAHRLHAKPCGGYAATEGKLGHGSQDADHPALAEITELVDQPCGYSPVLLSYCDTGGSVLSLDAIAHDLVIGRAS